jgi:conjugal transfer pilus assembly protein TraE
MDKQVYDSRLHNANRIVRTAMLVCGFLAIGNVVLTGVVWKTLGTQRQVLVFPDMKGPISFDGRGRYNEEYLSQMATWFAQLTLTYHPSSYDYQVRELLKYADPAAYGALRTQLLAEKETLERRKYSSVFYPEGVEVQNGVVGIRGRLRTYVGSRQIDDRPTAWRVAFTRLSTGRIAIRELKETDYDNPLGMVAAAAR